MFRIGPGWLLFFLLAWGLLPVQRPANAASYQQICEQMQAAIDTRRVQGVQHEQVISVLAKARSHCRTQPVTWHFLAVIVRHSELSLAQHSYSRVGFSDAEIASIKTLHRKFESWIYAATARTVTVKTTYLILDEPLRTLTLAKSDQGYWAAPRDLQAGFSKLDLKPYQSIIAWVKIPDQVPRFGGGVTVHEPKRTKGTLYSCAILKARDWQTVEQQGYEPIIISHEFYHQITMALVRELKYPDALFPSNHPPATIAAEGRRLLPAGATRREWYTRVLSCYITPRMWRELLAWQQRYRQTPAP